MSTPNPCGHHRTCKLQDGEQVILDAVKTFDFDDYGCDEMMELVADPSLDVAPHLAAHIARALYESAARTQ